jgi:5-methylcytosine-specific restriction endonuclease McrBC regulatory subunit McrC
MSEKSDRKSRTVFAMDDESADSLRGAIIRGKEALANKENEFKWDNPSLSLIASALRILNEQNKVIIKQNDLIIREMDNTRIAPVKTK